MKENPTQKMYAFLVNTKPNGHAFFKKGDLDKIEKTLAGPRGDYILLRNMINLHYKLKLVLIGEAVLTVRKLTLLVFRSDKLYGLVC